MESRVERQGASIGMNDNKTFTDLLAGENTRTELDSNGNVILEHGSRAVV